MDNDHPSSSSSSPPILSHDERIAVARIHFERKGYRVHSGLQFGCELVLYADDPDRVHSDFCVHIVGSDSRMNWMTIQTLARSMSVLHKQLIVADVSPTSSDNSSAVPYTVKTKCIENTNATEVEAEVQGREDTFYFEVDELAISSGHAPFRHKRQAAPKKVGGQVKKQKK